MSHYELTWKWQYHFICQWQTQNKLIICMLWNIYYRLLSCELSVVISPLNWWYVILTDGHVLMVMCFSWFSNWFGRFFSNKKMYGISMADICKTHCTITYFVCSTCQWQLKKYGNMNSISLSFQLRWLLSAMLEVQAPWDWNFIW